MFHSLLFYFYFLLLSFLFVVSSLFSPLLLTLTLLMYCIAQCLFSLLLTVCLYCLQYVVFVLVSLQLFTFHYYVLHVFFTLCFFIVFCCSFPLCFSFVNNFYCSVLLYYMYISTSKPYALT